MALQWMILTYIVAAEAALAFILTIPSPKVLKNRLVSLVSLILQPALFIVPFAAFQLLDIYWKSEHRLMCNSEICTAAERDRSEKSIVGDILSRLNKEGFSVLANWEGKLDLYGNTFAQPTLSSKPFMRATMYKAQRNVILCASACILYWCLFRICKYYKDIQSLEEAEKRFKDQ